METASEESKEVALQTGVVAIPGKNAAFMDPVRVLNGGYEAHDVKSERYYARGFFTSSSVADVAEEGGGVKKRKRKRKREVYMLNEKEAVAESRHQEVRSVTLEAHEAFQATVAPLLRRYIAFSDDDNPSKSCSMTQKPTMEEGELNFVELAAMAGSIVRNLILEEYRWLVARTRIQEQLLCSTQFLKTQV